MMNWKLIFMFLGLNLVAAAICAWIDNTGTVGANGVSLLTILQDPGSLFIPTNAIQNIQAFFKALLYDYPFLNEGWHIWVRYFFMMLSAAAIYAFGCTIAQGVSSLTQLFGK